MNGGEFLQTSHAAEPLHGPFSSSKRQVCILSSVVFPAAGFLPGRVADVLHCRAVGPEFVGNQEMRTAEAFHSFPEKFQRCFAIPALCDIAFQNPALVIHGTLKVMRLSIDLHKNLIQMPLPV